MSLTISPTPAVPLFRKKFRSLSKPFWKNPTFSKPRHDSISVARPKTLVCAVLCSTLPASPPLLLDSATPNADADAFVSEFQSFFFSGLRYLFLRFDSLFSDVMAEFYGNYVKVVTDAVETRSTTPGVQRNEKNEEFSAHVKHLLGLLAGLFPVFEESSAVILHSQTRGDKLRHIGEYKVALSGRLIESFHSCNDIDGFLSLSNHTSKLVARFLRPGQINVPFCKPRGFVSAFKESRRGGLPKKEEQKWIHEGLITESLPNGMFRVRLDNEDMILGYISGKMRKNFIRILPGDRVKVEVSRYDSTRGRIILRLRNKTTNE